MEMQDFPLLFIPCQCELSSETQTFIEMEGELTKENIEAFNKGRIKLLADWHGHKATGNVERKVFTYKNGEYTGEGLVYVPKDHPGESMPVVVYYHGGGWVTLCKECYEYECAAIAEQAGCVVFNVDYRCAPFYRFPVPLQDCYAAFQAVKEKAAEYGGDAERIALAGDSAGGNLALGVSLMAREKNEKVDYLALAYPVVGIDGNTDEFALHYLENLKAAENPLVSPIMDEYPERMPALSIIIGTCDFLLDQNLRYMRKLQMAGADAELALYQGMPHGFIQMTTPPGKEAVRIMAEKIRTHLYQNNRK